VSNTKSIGCLALAFAAACGGSEHAGNVSIADSAGVNIVQSTRPVWSSESGWHLAANPILDIGRSEGEAAYQLFLATAAVRLTDGRLAVANTGSQEIRFYDAAGRYLSAFGALGDGPGEFRNLGWLRRFRGDSLLAFDWSSQRFTVIGPRGTLGRSFRAEGVTGGAPIDVWRTGDILIQVPVTAAIQMDAVGLKRDTVLFIRLSPEGIPRDTIGRFLGPETLVQSLGGTTGIAPAAFGRTTHAAVRGEQVLIGTGEQFSIGVYSWDGRLEQVFQSPRAPAQVTARDIAAYREERLASALPGRREYMEQLLAGMVYPKTLPAHGALLVDDRGRTWVREYTGPGQAEQRWTVFEEGGVLLGTVGMPLKFRPTHIGDDFVLGLAKDEDDVEHVRMYPLLKP
jgi:hypothetical protein